VREILVNPNVAAPARSPLQRTLIPSALVVTSPLWLSLTLVVMLARAIQSAVLYGVAWAWIGGARRRVIFVYSDSPNWKTHVEVNIQPRLPQKSIVLNWSHRTVWKRFDVPVLLFRRFAGTKEFNPIGLVFERFRPVKRFRFWQPFRDDRHGKPEALQLMEKAFLDAAL
jgi:hypothetical protein